ncbi:zinc-binding dehydrogenase [Micromonospora sp. 067-2]|uniref:zinc-binding dehydrogenase n=1 Tax=Micromonospora sp. 067-2 TaxID=2789270 RepID=UPI003978AA5F
MRTTEIRLVRRPAGPPTPADFALVETTVREPRDGEVLVRNQYMTLAAVMRQLIRGGSPGLPEYPVGQVMSAKTWGEVVVSQSPLLPAGSRVLHTAGWREYAVGPASGFRVAPPGDPLLHLSSGLTVFAGLRLVDLRPRETVYVSSAAGAVGSLAGPIARALGAGRIVGSAGTTAKVTDLVDRLGFDAGFDRSRPVETELARLAPDGIDVYFDNVGGEHLASVVTVMNPNGRVALCGALAQQLGDMPGTQLDLLAVIGKRLTLRGFTAAGHPEFESGYLQLMGDNGITVPHRMVDGLAAAPQALLDLFAGRQTGTVVVRIDPKG